MTSFKQSLQKNNKNNRNCWKLQI